MRLSDIRNRTIPIVVDYDGEKVDATVRPAVHTSEFEDRLVGALECNDAKATAGLLAELVTFIDVIDDDGTPITCDEVTFYATLPLLFMAEVWRSAGMAIRPGEAKGETSDAG